MTFAIHQFYCILFHTHSADQALHKPQSVPLGSLLKISWGTGRYFRVTKLYPHTDPQSAYRLPASCPSQGTHLSFSRGHFQLHIHLTELTFTYFQSGLGNGCKYPVKIHLEQLRER